MILADPEYYDDDYEFPVRLPLFKKTRIQIIEGDTFTIAKRFDNPCCLNFASSQQPGGGYQSVKNLPMKIKTQEEDLFRRSNLPLLMDNDWVRLKYPLKGCCAFYCGTLFCDVLVTKDAELNSIPNYRVSVITMPAVANPRSSEDQELVKRKAKRILEIAAHHRHYDLILGAWGCGVFNNNPDDIATIFKKLIREEFEGIFDLVLFAIPGKESITYKMFENVLMEKEIYGN